MDKLATIDPTWGLLVAAVIAVLIMSVRSFMKNEVIGPHTVVGTLGLLLMLVGPTLFAGCIAYLNDESIIAGGGIGFGCAAFIVGIIVLVIGCQNDCY